MEYVFRSCLHVLVVLDVGLPILLAVLAHLSPVDVARRAVVLLGVFELMVMLLLVGVSTVMWSLARGMLWQRRLPRRFFGVYCSGGGYFVDGFFRVLAVT